MEYINYEISRYAQIFLTATAKKFSAVRKYKKKLFFVVATKVAWTN